MRKSIFSIHIVNLNVRIYSAASVQTTSQTKYLSSDKGIS